MKKKSNYIKITRVRSTRIHIDIYYLFIVALNMDGKRVSSAMGDLGLFSWVQPDKEEKQVGECISQEDTDWGIQGVAYLQLLLFLVNSSYCCSG